MRRLAAHEIAYAGHVYEMSVAIIDDDGEVLEIRHLQGEEAYTEWHVGRLTLADKNNNEKVQINKVQQKQ